MNDIIEGVATGGGVVLVLFSARDIFQADRIAAHRGISTAQVRWVSAALAGFGILLILIPILI